MNESLVGPTGRLVEFLRDLATARQPRQSDVRASEQVLWFADLPAQVTLFSEAGAGDLLFSVDPVPAEPPPAVPPGLDVDPDTLDDPTTEPEIDATDPAARAWLERWRGWAEADRRTAGQRRWYAELARTARRLSQQDDEYELVVATGLLGWRTPGRTILGHLLATRAQAAVDPRSGRVDVRIADSATTRLADRDLLDGVDGFAAARAEPVREELRAGSATPLADGVKDLLDRWRGLALARSRPYQHVPEPITTPDEAAELRFAPALVLRRRDRSTLIDYYDQMLAALSGPGAVAPLGLAQLVTALETDERLRWLGDRPPAVGADPLFPLPANPEQRQVAARLRADNGVVVQGPPGTGKTHTIANLIAALLAEGQRVLVTSQKAQALRVLRDKLPGPAKQLCVSMTDLARGGSLELSESVNALSDRYSRYDPAAHAAEVDALARRRAAAQQAVEECKEQMRSLRATEEADQGTVAPGYAGTLGRIGEALRRDADRLGWIPVPLPVSAPPEAPRPAAAQDPPRPAAAQDPPRPAVTHDGPRPAAAQVAVGRATVGRASVKPPPSSTVEQAPALSTVEQEKTPAEAPPLDVGELGELCRLLREGTPRRQARRGQVLPQVASVPSAVDVRDLVVAEQAAQAAARAAATELSRQLSSVDGATLDAVATHVQRVAAALAALRLDGSPAAWPSPRDDWRVHALAAGFAQREVGVWRQLAAQAGQVAHARAALATIGLRRVTLPPLAESSGVQQLDGGQRYPAAALLHKGEALLRHLDGGGELKRMLKPAVQREAEPLLERASIDGVPVSDRGTLRVVVEHLRVHVLADQLADAWAGVGVRFDRAAPLAYRIAQLEDAARDLATVGTVLVARDEVERLLSAAGARVPLRSPLEWAGFVAALGAVRTRVAADEAAAAVARQVERLHLASRAPQSPPELAALATALAARDADGYATQLAALADAHLERAAQQRCDLLLDRLRSGHPGLAELLVRTADDPVWEARLATLDRAWAWARARTYFDSRRDPGAEQRLDRDLDDAVRQLERLTGELAAARAWGHCLDRMTAAQAQALRAYSDHVTSRGKGTGRYAHVYERAAREAMVTARGAVPAWIMPLAEVLDTIPPDRDSFDVVIVDEASQASLDALFLLWLAPRVVVVGDDRQCTPSQVSHGELQPIFDKLDDYLPDLPYHLRVAFTPRSSLYSLLSTRFGSVIRLREHFRCMPEIVAWSSRQFYADAPLVPLRQYGADRLDPLRVTRVPDATTTGTGPTLVNEAEATALVDQLAACLADPAYEDRTFGVVVLQGQAQVRLIDDLIDARIPPDEEERRRLRVGTPPDFQGDERDVVFVSMVAASRRGALTAMEWQRRFNVAATRARDQMWLFCSVAPADLSPADLRRSLLSYLLDPPPALAAPVEGVTADDPHPDFDSLFAQRVYLALRGRGFHVTPRVEVNGRLLDLVVTGAEGRLAIECDGDRPYGRTPDLDRELELKRAGWRFWRLRDSEFSYDPAAALVPLWAELDRRGIRPYDVTPAPDTSSWQPTRLSAKENGDMEEES